MNQFIGMTPNEFFDNVGFYKWAKEFCDENGLITFQHYHIGKIQGHQCYFSGCAICWYQDMYEYPNGGRPAPKLYFKCSNLNCKNDMEKHVCEICKNKFCPQCLFTLLNDDSDWHCQTCLYLPGGYMFQHSQKEIEKLLK